MANLTSSSGVFRGSTAGEGGNQIGSKRRFGEGAGGDTPPGGAGRGLPREHF